MNIKSTDEENIGEKSILILEKSMTARMFTIKEQVNPFNEVKKLAKTNTTNLIIGIFLLLFVLISGALKAPLTLSLTADNIFVKLAWRAQGGLIIWIAISWYMYIRYSSTMSFIKDIGIQILVDSALKSLLGFIWKTAFFMGWSMTITSHAQIAFNATGIYILIFSLIVWSKINKFELAGHGLWIIGMILLMIDPYAIKVGSDKPSILGTLIVFIGAGFGSILMFVNNSKTTLHPVITMTHFYFFSVIFSWKNLIFLIKLKFKALLNNQKVMILWLSQKIL